MCPRCGAYEGTCSCSLTQMGSQMGQASPLATNPIAGLGTPPAADERAALLEFLRDFTTSTPLAADGPAPWPVVPEDDPSYDPSGGASSHAFLSRFAAAASAPQATSLLAPVPDPFWEPDWTGPATTRRRTAPAKSRPVDTEPTATSNRAAASSSLDGPQPASLPEAAAETAGGALLRDRQPGRRRGGEFPGPDQSRRSRADRESASRPVLLSRVTGSSGCESGRGWCILERAINWGPTWPRCGGAEPSGRARVRRARGPAARSGRARARRARGRAARSQRARGPAARARVARSRRIGSRAGRRSVGASDPGLAGTRHSHQPGAGSADGLPGP